MFIKEWNPVLCLEFATVVNVQILLISHLFIVS